MARTGVAAVGLIPSWADDAKIGYSTINSKAETVAPSPAFMNHLAPNDPGTVRLTVKVTAPSGTVITENAATSAIRPSQRSQ